ncbi:Uncharacterised protein [Shigella sonnei]|nr:Uncharacterised protein [Shigella sonnei]CSE86062.1 Uncharacterised protein [Shigella sonnei]CSF51159.1 Uncharacterised protein [Shigella sonnei]CSF92634.1 Uncharacterised protein [Shigella sonnei]CSG32581.1 Uncharacterised protein [Shigella sonnei]
MSYHHRTRSIDLLLNTFCSADIITVSLTKRRSLCFITGKNVAPITVSGVRQIQQLVTKPLNIRSQRGPVIVTQGAIAGVDNFFLSILDSSGDLAKYTLFQ